jgi:hypothetical protein
LRIRERGRFRGKEVELQELAKSMLVLTLDTNRKLQNLASGRRLKMYGN